MVVMWSVIATAQRTQKNICCQEIGDKFDGNNEDSKLDVRFKTHEILSLKNVRLTQTHYIVIMEDLPLLNPDRNRPDTNDSTYDAKFINCSNNRM